MRWKTLSREKHTKKEGWLAELISLDHEDEPFEGVHSYVVSFEPETTRAMHYHKTKKEWLTIGSGKVKVVLEDIDTGENETIIISEEDEEQNILYLPPKIAHGIKNVGDRRACVIAFSQTPEIPGDTIKYEMDV